MVANVTARAKRHTTRAPRIVIAADDLPRIEALAESAVRREPALANRLLDEIYRARIVPVGKMPKNVVSIGNNIVYRDETTGRENSVTLVFPEDADIAQGRVSLMTPIGVALLGLPEGAKFHWDTRDNERRVLTVIRVS